jgi:hypothetical protein
MSTTYQAKLFVGIIVQDYPQVLRYFMTKEQYERCKKEWHEEVKLMMNHDKELKDIKHFLETQISNLKGGQTYPNTLDWEPYPDNEMRGNRHLIGRVVWNQRLDCFSTSNTIEDLIKTIQDAREEVNQKLNPMNRVDFKIQVWCFVDTY